MSIIGDRIKERRKYLELSVDDVARELGKNRATIYRYENGDIEDIPANVIEPLAEILRTTPAYLMGWTNTALSLSEIKEILRELQETQKILDGAVKRINGVKLITSSNNQTEQSMSINIGAISGGVVVGSQQNVTINNVKGEWRRFKPKDSKNLDRLQSLIEKKNLSREDLILILSTIELNQNVLLH